MRARQTLPGIVLSALLGVACTSESESPPELGPPPELPWAREAFPTMPAPDDNPHTEEKAELGRLLFYDPILSRDRAVACASCHSELWGLGDGLPLSVGVGGTGPTGPGRHGPNVTERNAPTLWNVGYRTALFWDGRAATLEEQALFPIENAVEMGRDIDTVVSDLASIGRYVVLFEQAFPDDAEPVTADNLARALAAFQRTFVSRLAPYDRYSAGDEGALDAESVRGMFLFEEVGCATCHTPPLFQSMQYAGRGVGDDPGRYMATEDESDWGRFRVPTLRNARETGPYFHDGSVLTLEEAVAHEARQAEREIDDRDVAAIARFINKGLMDRSREPDRAEQVPSGLEVPRDGSRIPR
jgi:cytochrome c peroxidase